MRKFLTIVVALLLAISLQNCANCSNPKEQVKAQTELVSIATDSLDMFSNYGTDYRWYETCVLMDEFLDEETDGSVEMYSNVFQSIVARGNGFDTQVFKYQHFKDGSFIKDSVKGFWIEDYPLKDSLVKISYEQAFELIQRVNLPKPHSRNAILRNPIGPIGVNPQWVFGNISEQLWVDAVTGEIKTSNPAFPDNLKMPLGEWP